ncbi:MAG: hypothetical protein JETT_3394 [Candidatus Jettenia ecosi]|uniref:Transcriptional coactivator p15 (PC4) C-terminal domain-containing protein n=1 Tax=Candidatus Jettenia ecosi TaxID=2494326 RepID=A0A533Q6Y5_9BACT|nr:MAG: hypothetical protein JETT_3394 [Candidatus Jettenia ecosi]
MDNGKVLGEIVRNETEKLVITEKEFKGHRYIDIRIHFQGNNGIYLPTKKGVTISPRHVKDAVEILKKGIV